MNLPVAILAGGKATRLYPVTQTIPKSLLQVAGKPFICHQLGLLRDSGVQRVVVCGGFLGSHMQQELGDGGRFGLRIDHVSDGPNLLGTGGALRQSLPVLGQSFLVLYGDSYLEIDYAAVERRFIESGRLGLMTVFRNRGRWDRSNVHFSGGRVLAYDKKNPLPEMQHIDYGLGAFHAEAFAGFPRGQCLDLAEVYQRLIAENQLAGLEMSRRFYEIGSPQGLEETRAYLAERNDIRRQRDATKGKENGNQHRDAGNNRAVLRAKVSE